MDELIDGYYDFLKKKTFVTTTEDMEWEVITTPFFNCQNDYIQVYLCFDEYKDSIFISDDGATLSNLKMRGIDIKSVLIQEQLSSICNIFGIKLLKNKITEPELSIRTKLKVFASSFHNLIQGILTIDSLNNNCNERSKCTAMYYEDVYFLFYEIKSLGSMKKMLGNAYFGNSMVVDLGDLETICKDVDFRCSKITNIKKLSYIGGDAYCTADQTELIEQLKKITIKGKLIIK